MISSNEIFPIKGQITRSRRTTKLTLEVPRFSSSAAGVSRPIRAILAGVLLFTLIVPLLEAALVSQRYALAAGTKKLIDPVSGHLKEKLSYDKAAKVYRFNSEALESSAEQPNLRVTAGNYTADMPRDPKQGIKLTDPASKLSMKAVPEFPLMDAGERDGYIVYPLAGLSSQLIYTIKGNGLKEDIILSRYSGDKLNFSYNLELSGELEARMMEGGGVGLFSADPALFGNITYGSEADKEKLEAARRDGLKDHLVFAIPAPIIKDASGQSYTDRAKFRLERSRLTVETEQLKGLAYPLTIDPSFIVTSASDFGKGSDEGNIEFDSAAGQIKRGGLTGGSNGSWTNETTNALPVCLSRHGSVVHDGRVYVIGGIQSSPAPACGTNDGFVSTVRYATLNSNGSVGPWATTTSLPIIIASHAVAIYNGYIYSSGGGGTNLRADTYYAKINTDGTIGSWQSTTALPSARNGHWHAVYNGYLYLIGGCTVLVSGLTDCSSATSAVHYAPIKTDGSLGSWTATTSFAGDLEGRQNMRAAAYNSMLYLTGGQNAATNTGYNDTKLAKINADGTIGSWETGPSFTTSRANHGMVAHRGYLYINGGAIGTTDLQYVEINADGTLGTWRTGTAFTQGRHSHSSVSYQGYVYIIGGQAGGNEKIEYTKISSAGEVSRFSTSSTLNTARVNHASVVVNDYVYAIGGCIANPCGAGTASVEYARINANGTLGSWSTTIALPALTGQQAGRWVSSAVAHDGFIYVIGGVSRNSLNTADVLQNSVLYARVKSDGTIDNTGPNTSCNPVPTATTGWCTSSIELVAAAGGMASVVYTGCTATACKPYIYVTGGAEAAGPGRRVQYTSITTGGSGELEDGAAPTLKFTDGPLMLTPRSRHAAVVEGDYLYALGGVQTSGGETSATERIRINPNGTLPTVAPVWVQTASLPAARHIAGAAAINGKIYMWSGRNNAGLHSSVIAADINISDGMIGDGTTNSSNWTTLSSTINTARVGFGSAVANGHIYTIGGCNNDCTSIFNSTEIAAYHNGGSGATSWSSSSSTLTTSRDSPLSLMYNGRLYIVGGFTGGATSTRNIQSGKVNADGTITWENEPDTPPLCNGTQGPFGGGLAVYANQLFLMVGASGNCNSAWNSIYRASLDSSGRIKASPDNPPTDGIHTCSGAWCLDASFNECTAGSADCSGTTPDRARFNTVQHNDYVYAFGGLSAGGNQADGRTDYTFARVEPNTANQTTFGVYLQRWTRREENPLPTGRIGTASVYHNGHVYLMGGVDYTDGAAGDYRADVIYAKLNPAVADGLDTPSGCTAFNGNWCRGTPMPFGAQAGVAVQANGFITYTGGVIKQAGAALINGFSYSVPIRSDGSLGRWFHNPSVMSNPRTYPGYGYHNGRLYLAAGDSAVGRLNTEIHATLLSTGRVGQYSRRFDTDVDTVPTKLLVNGSSVGTGGAHAVKYRTACNSDNVFGAENQLSLTFGSLNTLVISNSCTGVARGYHLNFAIDDTATAVFPDSSSTITEFILWYRPNPGRRLRGGKTFTGGELHGLDAPP